jgi:hypothetical protein
MELGPILFTNIKLFIIVHLILLLFNFIRPFKLEDFQYYEAIFGMIFIVIFFGIFQLLMTLNPDTINDSLLFASLYGIWYYFTKKICNAIHSDTNGVIRF